MLSNRYQRQIIMPEIGIEGQKKLKEASVLVVGAGGLGCPILMYLAGAGIGRLGIIDYDLVEASNLHRQVLFSESDIDRPKAIVAREKLSHQNPGITIHAFFESLNPENAQKHVRGYDLVMEGSDNFATKFLVNDACILENKPFILGGVSRFDGQFSVFNFEGGPTYRCLAPESAEFHEGLACAEEGILGPVPGFIGSLMALEAIKLITGVGPIHSGHLIHINGLSLESTQFEFTRDPLKSRISQLKSHYRIDCRTEAPGIDGNTFKRLMTDQPKTCIIDIRERPGSRLPWTNVIQCPWQTIQETGRIPGRGKRVLVCDYGIVSKRLLELLSGESKGGEVVYLREGLEGLRFSIPKREEGPTEGFS